MPTREDRPGLARGRIIRLTAQPARLPHLQAGPPQVSGGRHNFWCSGRSGDQAEIRLRSGPAHPEVTIAGQRLPCRSRHDHQECESQGPGQAEHQKIMPAAGPGGTTRNARRSRPWPGGTPNDHATAGPGRNNPKCAKVELGSTTASARGLGTRSTEVASGAFELMGAFCVVGCGCWR